MDPLTLKAASRYRSDSDHRLLCTTARFYYSKAAERASAAAADIQLFVELFIQLALLGIEYRHILLLNLFRRRTRWKLLGAGLQMADRRAAIHRRPGASDGGRIAESIAQNKGTAEDHGYEKSCAHGIAPPRLSA
jgi:hypothetical protein